jgi:hypothetical protein
MQKETSLKIEYEISQIDELISETEPLLKLSHLKIPDNVETSALGLFLHSFYNGIENITKIINKEKYGKLPSSIRWHKELLDLCFVKEKDNKQLFDNELKDVLDDYLSFRHFIRHTYSYKIKWERMEHLILNIDNNWNKIKFEILKYIEQYKQ